MSEVIEFNYSLDKITEREVVYDFLSRLSIGLDIRNNDDGGRLVFPAGMKFKDGVLMNMIKTMDTSHIHHLDTIKTAYKTVKPGEKSVIIAIPEGGILYRIVQEKTGQDVTPCFVKSDNSYKANFDTAATIADTYKAYYYTA